MTKKRKRSNKIDFVETDPSKLADIRRKLAVERNRLPIASAKQQLIEEFENNETLVIVGETGSGKSTQIPQYFLESLRRNKQSGMVGITQPRRVAAITVSQRVAAEMGVDVGDKCGYAIRFEDKTSKNTEIKFMTDGLLLREAMSDPLLRRYAAIILDEAHERTVQSDILFGILKQVQHRRKQPVNGKILKPLHLTIMSATLDAEKFCDYFQAKALYVQGRQFPVRILHTLEPQPDILDSCMRTVLQIHIGDVPGDILVFLTGQDEIESLQSLLRTRVAALRPEHQQLMVCAVFSALDQQSAMKAFDAAPKGWRKCVLATNIAETSVTIAGVRFVVDSGRVKMRGCQRSGLSTLAVLPVSKAAATQRTGRAGRDGPGVCYRLFTEEAFTSMIASAPPELQRINLGSVVLQLKALGIANPQSFDYLDPPPYDALHRAFELLLGLGALKPSDGSLTPIGQKMSQMPLEPRFSRALLASEQFDCTSEVLCIVAMLSIDDQVFFAPRDKRHQSDKAKRNFASHGGDPLALLNVYRAFVEASKQDALNDWCQTHFISVRAMRKAVSARRQLSELLTSIGLNKSSSCGDEYNDVSRSLVAGFFTNAALLNADKRSYHTLSEKRQVSIHPSSVMHADKNPARCVVYIELIHTTRAYMQEVFPVELKWLHEAAPRYFGLTDSTTSGVAV